MSETEKDKKHDTFTIIVNTRKKTVDSKIASFEEVVRLAFEPVPPGTLFTVTYRGAAHHQEGALQAGGTVEIKDGTIFNVTETGQS